MSAYAQRQFEYNPAYEGRYRANPKAKTGNRNRGISVRSKKKILGMVMLLGLIGLIAITSVAYAASINYSNNKLKEQNAAITGEVEGLKIEIQSANNIADIEKKAKKSPGMIYAEGKKYVVLSSEKRPVNNFASRLKAEAFK